MIIVDLAQGVLRRVVFPAALLVMAVAAVLDDIGVAIFEATRPDRERVSEP